MDMKRIALVIMYIFVFYFLSNYQFNLVFSIYPSYANGKHLVLFVPSEFSCIKPLNKKSYFRSSLYNRTKIKRLTKKLALDRLEAFKYRFFSWLDSLDIRYICLFRSSWLFIDFSVIRKH